MKDDRTPLAVADPCWLLKGTLLYEVTIREVNVILAGDPLEFTMYKVTSDHSWIAEASQHRNDLFLRPQERAPLLQRLEGDIETLQGMVIELEDLEDEDDNPRERGDDDGVEYADPRDRRDGIE